MNRVEQISGPLTGTIVPAAVSYFSSTDLMLGINPWGYPTIGMVDEVGCWSRALSADEVEQLFNNGDGLTYEGF